MAEEDRATPTWTEWGGDGPVLHLAHGNGFPPGAYRRLAERLTDHFRVVSMAARPLWPGTDPDRLESWRPLADDLRRALARRRLEGCIGVGHSLGAVTSILAAAAHPGSFSALVLVDPVMFTGLRRLGWALMKVLGQSRRLRLVRLARHRRDHWPSREAALESYASKEVFQGWAEGVLADYVHSGLEIDPSDGFRLRYPPRWEARIFERTPASVWSEAASLEIPMLFLRGARSDTFTAAAARRAARLGDHVEVETVPEATHFLPMERPEETAARIVGFIEGREG